MSGRRIASGRAVCYNYSVSWDRSPPARVTLPALHRIHKADCISWGGMAPARRRPTWVTAQELGIARRPPSSSGRTVVNYTEEVLDALRQEGDPLADRVIAEIHATGVGGAVNGVLRQLMENDQPIPDNVPPLVREYLHITDNPPAWMDAARMARANAFFESHGMHISLVMSTAGMIECYAARKAVKVLDFTHQLDHPQRRMAEPAQFCLHMLMPQAFAP